MRRKFLITLVLFLFLFPFISWYYLRSGLSWRKDAQAKMDGTELVLDIPFIDVKGKKHPSSVFSENVSLVSYLPCEQDTSWYNLVSLLYNHFKETKKANLIFLDSCSTSGIVIDSSWKKTFIMSCDSTPTLCDQWKESWVEGTSFALVDRKRVIRSYYPVGNREEKKLLLEHMALLLPGERTEKVELKRGVNQ